MGISKNVLAIIAAVAAAVLARAQSVTWEPSGGELGFNQVSELALVFDNCEPEDVNVRLPQVDGLTFGTPSTRREQSFSFGTGGNRSINRFTLAYPVRPTTRQSLRIPQFVVETDKGRITVQAASFTVGDARLGRSGGGPLLAEIAESKLSVPKNTFWAGEVFPVTNTLSIIRDRYNGIDETLHWQPAPLVAEDWSKPRLVETVVGGERRVLSTQTTRAYSKEPGNYSLGPTNQIASLVVGSAGFSIFSQPVVESRQILSAPVDITVKPLPAPPANFSGAVGEFTLTSKVVPMTGSLNDPITWTVELAGTGNWPDIAGLPAREVSRDFQVVQPRSKRTMADNSLFEGTLTEDVVLVPTRPGSYTLGPVRFTYFDTRSGAYRTVSTDPVTVNVSGTPAPSPTQPATGPQFTLPQVGTTPAAPDLPTPVAPIPPEGLPRDPLTEPRHGSVPLAKNKLWILATVPAAATALAVWLVFAALRSVQTDDQRRRREARRRLADILSRLRTSGANGATPDLLRDWQREVATLFAIDHSAPGAPILHARVSTYARDAAAAWTALWHEVDRALHGRERTLPADWALRAEGALQATRVPGWSPLSLFSPRNLLPFLVAAIVALAPVSLDADTGNDAYQRADFATAESAWRHSLANDPTNVTLRHNLGLALAQQDRWAEATALWTSAFLLDPSSDNSKWHLSLGLQRSGLAPLELVEFSRGEGAYRCARWCSPAGWQFVLIGASFAIALALIGLILRGYGRIGAWAMPASIALCLLAVVSAGAATWSLRTYGHLANPDVALVWKPSVLRSIPTEADATQKTSPLSAGSIAVVDHSFLGWSRLVFPSGQTGWARSDDIFRLYR